MKRPGEPRNGTLTALEALKGRQSHIEHDIGNADKD